jgi:hypothetical protein
MRLHNIILLGTTKHKHTLFSTCDSWLFYGTYRHTVHYISERYHTYKNKMQMSSLEYSLVWSSFPHHSCTGPGRESNCGGGGAHYSWYFTIICLIGTVRAVSYSIVIFIISNFISLLLLTLWKSKSNLSRLSLCQFSDKVPWLPRVVFKLSLEHLWPPLTRSRLLSGHHENHLTWMDLSLMALLELAWFWVPLATSHEVQPPVWVFRNHLIWVDSIWKVPHSLLQDPPWVTF